jgi:triosephosphate isomerase
MLCVGEKLEQRDAGKAEETVLAQLRTGLSKMTQLQHRPISIAYEPCGQSAPDGMQRRMMPPLCTE